ncbi:putative protein SET-like [Capsicum annuum]|nr:putative protein SET-like [Capsicum annuum]
MLRLLRVDSIDFNGEGGQDGGRLHLDVVVSKSSSIFKLFSSKYYPLLIRGNDLLILNFCFNIVNGDKSLDLKDDDLFGEGLNKDLNLKYIETHNFVNFNSRSDEKDNKTSSTRSLSKKREVTFCNSPPIETNCPHNITCTSILELV